MDSLKLVCVFLLLVHVKGQASRRRLTHDLLGQYDKVTIPAMPPLNVTHALQLKRIVSFKDQVLTVDGYVSMSWRDDQLIWDPYEYNDIKMIRLPSGLLWKPDIILENNADLSSGVGNADINFVISFDGFIFYTPPVQLKSYCKLDKTKTSRYSEVRCILKFMSWTYDGLALNLESDSAQHILADFDDNFNKDWRLQSASVDRNELFYSCCPDTPYIEIEYTLVLKRR